MIHLSMRQYGKVILNIYRFLNELRPLFWRSYALSCNLSQKHAKRTMLFLALTGSFFPALLRQGG